MIPKKVRKILSIMIAVALVMAVIPAVAFADEVNTLFGNGDETVASTGDATENEEDEQEAAAISQDENVPQSDETIATDEAGAGNVANTQPEDAAQTDTAVELTKNRGNSSGNLNSVTGLNADNNNENSAGLEIDSSNKDGVTRVDDDTSAPAYIIAVSGSAQKLPIVKYNGVVLSGNSGTTSDGKTYSITYNSKSDVGEPETDPDHIGNYIMRASVGVYDESDYQYVAIYFGIVKKTDVPLGVEFYKNDGTEECESITVYPGDYIPNDARNPYSEAVSCDIVEGWYTEPECQNSFDLNTPITYSIINNTTFRRLELYAKWGTSHKGTLTHHDEVPATCATTGTIEYWQCSECSRYYSDQAGTEANEIATADVVIPKDDNAHDWEQPTYQWENDNSAVTASRVCKNDASHIESEVGTVTSEVTQKATCSVTEETTYTATFTNPVFATQTKTVTSGDIDPNAHDWGEVTYKWAKDNSSVTAIRTCKNNVSHNETETVSTTKTVTKEATETAPGDILYSAEFSNPAFKKQTKYEEIPAKGSSEKQPEEKKSEEPTADEEAFYINASGDKITWTVGSTDTLNIKFERSEDNASTSKHFLGIEVDGKGTSKDLYDTEDGSIIIKLKPALLESLGEGEHTLTALFDDGSASAKFTIIKATKEVKNEKKTTSKNAKTGDASPIKLVIIIMIVSALACAGVLVIKKKRR